MNRRAFIQNSSLITLFSVSNFAYSNASKNNNKSVIWIWLPGGASHFECFNVNNLDVVENYRSVIGTTNHTSTGIRMGGLWENLINKSNYLNVIANFSHNDAGHEQATHWVNTGHYQTERSQTPISKYPSYGSIISKVFGPNANDGMPIYISTRPIGGDGSAFLGNSYKPFDINGKKNLAITIDGQRFYDRNSLLSSLDKRGQLHNNNYREQAYQMVSRNISDNFDVEKIWQEKKDIYGNTDFGKNCLLAKQLVSSGAKFVTISTPFGWDWHDDILGQCYKYIPQTDIAIAGLIGEINKEQRNKDIMVIVTTEFGRTPLNKGNNGTSSPTGKPGRDHQPSLTPLLIYGGDYSSGRVIGEVDDKNMAPVGKSFGPIDLQHTIFDHCGIDKRIQTVDNAGRPRYLLDGESRNILI